MEKQGTEVKGRDTFASQFGLIMSIAGMSIGLGNIWRFPYMVGEYGGAVFVFAYIICVLLIAFPLAMIEVGMGKYMGRGLMETYATVFKKKKLGRAYGGLSAFIYFAMNFFYLLILASCVIFIFVSITGTWNTMPADQIYDTFYANKVLMTGVLVAIILLISFIVGKGITGGIELVSKYMVPLIFVFFAITIVMCIFAVPNIAEGYNWYLSPDFSQLANPKVWTAAMGQALFSIGVGPGSLLIYGSHMKKKSEVPLTVTTIVCLGASAGLIAGMVIIPACIALGLNPESGGKLIFVVLPSVFAQIPMGRLIGTIVLVGIFFAGLTSAIAQLEVAITTFEDGMNWTRKKTVIIFTLITLAVAIPGVFWEEMLNFWSDFAGNYAYTITAGIGAVAFNYIYGTDKILEDSVNQYSAFNVPSWFVKYVKFIVVPIMVIVMINSLIPIF